MTEKPTIKDIDWKAAKVDLNRLAFPKDHTIFKKTNSGEYHKDGKSSHSLVSYQLDLKPIRGFNVIAKYNHCETCRKVFNQVVTMLNRDLNLVYRKWYLKHGKIV